MKREKLNLKKAQKIIEDMFKDWLDITTEMEDERLICKADIVAKAYDDDISLMMAFYANGSGYIDFCFDYLDKDEETLDLVNTFNENVLRLKAAIGDNGFLKISYYEYVTEDTIAQIVKKVFDELVDDDTVKYLKPITEFTYADKEE